MGINTKFKESRDGFNCYASIFIDRSIIDCPWPASLYVRIVADHGAYIEFEDVNIYDHGDSNSLCPGCKKAHISRNAATRFIAKNAIAMIFIEDK